MPLCIMMVGVPGSGKSTKIEETLKELPHLKVVSSDEYLDKIAKEQGKAYDEVHSDNIDNAIKWMNSQIQSFIKSKQDFIWDQTNIVKSSRGKKIRNLQSNGYDIVAITFEISQEELMIRLNKRVISGGKNISDKIVQNMLTSYERPSYDEGFSSIVLIQDDGLVQELKKINKPKI